MLRSAHFWRVAPLGVFVTGGFFAIQGLWSASWLMDVNGLTRSAAASHLAGMNVAMLVTFFLIGTAGGRLARRGVGPAQLLLVGVGLGLAALLAIVTARAPNTRALWISYGAFSSCGPLVFAQASRGFPEELSGRANTALNLLVFSGAFGVQWGIGGAIDSLYIWRGRCGFVRFSAVDAVAATTRGNPTPPMLVAATPITKRWASSRNRVAARTVAVAKTTPSEAR